MSIPSLNPTAAATSYNEAIDQEAYEEMHLDDDLSKNLIADDNSDMDQDISQTKIYTQSKSKSKRKGTIRQSKIISPTKLALSNAMNIDFDRVPDYFSKSNASFERKIGSTLPSTIHIEELRKIALLMYKIFSLQLVHSLWIIYQKSCMGHLPSPISTMKDIDTKICPIEVQSNMKLCKFQFQKNESNPALTFVNHCLKQFNDESDQHRKHLNMKLCHQIGFTPALECNIERFVQQGLVSQRIEIDREIALVQYHYTDVLLKRAYLAQHPSETQIKIMKQRCKLKYDQEITKHEAKFLKQQIPQHISYHPFEKELIGQLSLIDDIDDPLLRQKLYKQYKDTAEQGRTKIMTLYLECVEAQKIYCEKQFNKELQEFSNTEKTLPTEQQLTRVMRTLIDQRLANITARIECLDKFKIQLAKLQ